MPNNDSKKEKDNDDTDKDIKKQCPSVGMLCPCGCGYIYSGFCLRKQPCIHCNKGKSNICV